MDTSRRGRRVQLVRLTRQIVYDMALPSYGPAQYVMQIDDAYLGNDFFDTYLMAKRHSAALGTAVSAELRNSANALEVAHPLEPELERLWVSAEPAGPVPTDNSRLRRWVSQHLKLWRVLSLVKRQFTAQGPGILAPDFETATRALSPSQRPYASLFNDGAWRTILTAPYRLRAVDDRDARIRLGVEVSRIALRTIARRCRASGTRLLVVFPPTKEDVFLPRVRNPEDHTRLRELVENEQRLKGELISSLAAEGATTWTSSSPRVGLPRSRISRTPTAIRTPSGIEPWQRPWPLTSKPGSRRTANRLFVSAGAAECDRGAG